MSATRNLAEFVSTLNIKNIPADVIAAAKISFCDWLAVAVAGAREGEIEGLLKVAGIMGGNEQATVIGRKVKTSALYATLINGMSSHTLDFDDTSKEFLGHTSVTVFPCSLAIGEWKKLSGADFLTAYIAGFETGCRVGLGASPNHYVKGWHATSTIGRFAAAAAAGRALRLNSSQLVFALGTAGTQAGGLQKVFGTSCKPFHAGKAGFDGFLSALLAKEGFSSIDNILEGEKCFWDMYSADWSEQKAEEGLGSIWYLPENIFKFHASCHFTHASIDAVLTLKERHGFDAEKIEQIEVTVPSQVVEIAGKKTPTQALEGKFSLPYTVANALIREDTGLAAFTDEKVNDKKVTALRDKVTMIVDETVASFESDVKIKTSGETYHCRLSLFDRKMAFAEKKKAIEVKFKSLAGPILGAEKTARLMGQIDALEQVSDITEITDLIG